MSALTLLACLHLHYACV